MSKQFEVTVKKIQGLRTELFRAHSSFRAFEVIQEMRAPNIIGDADASRNAKAMGNYKGFINIAEHALNNEFIVAMAKLYDKNQDGTSIAKLLNYIHGNIKHLKLQDFLEHSKDSSNMQDSRKDYKEVTLSDLDEIDSELNELTPLIEKLKTLRDKRVAHLELKFIDVLVGEETKVLKLTTTKIEDLTYDEIEKLITVADKLLNKISFLVYKDTADFSYLKEVVTQDTEQLIILLRKTYDSLPSAE